MNPPPITTDPHPPLVAQLSSLLAAEPFVPFSITTKDGKTYPVSATSQALKTKSTCLYLWPSNRVEQIPLASIRSLQTTP
jgi:hypothetical protein